MNEINNITNHPCPILRFFVGSTRKTEFIKSDFFNGQPLYGHNNCDVEKMQHFFTDDVEFYHDRGGLTLGLENLITSLRKNLCSNENFKLRRKSLKEGLKSSPYKMLMLLMALLFLVNMYFM